MHLYICSPRVLTDNATNLDVLPCRGWTLERSPMKFPHAQPDPEGQDPGASQVHTIVLGQVLHHLDGPFDQNLLTDSSLGPPEGTLPWVNLNHSTERITETHKTFHHVQGLWSGCSSIPLLNEFWAGPAFWRSWSLVGHCCGHRLYIYVPACLEAPHSPRRQAT